MFQEEFSRIFKNRSSDFSSLDESAAYYHFLSSLKLYHPDTELLFNNFMSEFALSNKKNDAIFFMSEYFFEKKKIFKSSRFAE